MAKIKLILIVSGGFLLIAALVLIIVKAKGKDSIDPLMLNVPTPTPVASSSQKPTGYSLVIDKLKIDVPIILNVDGSDKKAYDSALENGVAQMKDSALPGRAGNTVIFGHSSFYLSDKGNYKQVFAHLDQLKSDDKIIIANKSASLNYNVVENKIISNDDVSVVEQNLSQHFLTLLTCWPPGTTEKRLEIRAKLINEK